MDSENTLHLTLWTPKKLRVEEIDFVYFLHPSILNVTEFLTLTNILNEKTGAEAPVLNVQTLCHSLTGAMLACRWASSIPIWNAIR